MAEFGLVQSFDIDNGELDGQSSQQCFVLGYEFSRIVRLLKQDSAISRPVHAANRDRIEKSCRESGREFSLSWATDDSSESWMHLEVAPDETGGESDEPT